jgi:hypothetical protein
MARLRSILIQRPWWHSPAFWIAILAFAALAAMLTANYTVWSNPAVPSLPSLQRAIDQPFDSAQGKPVQPAPKVAPVVPHLNWVKIGQARNGNEVLALPIPWDRVVTDRGTANIPEGANPVLDCIRSLRGNYDLLPPAGYKPAAEARAYLLEGKTVILYAYSNYGWSEEDPQALTYWQAQVPLATFEGLCP